METVTLDKLYLEWSQFTKARNARELAMLVALKASRRVHQDMMESYEKGTSEHGMAADVVESIDAATAWAAPR